MKKNYILASLFVVGILFFTNTDFYKTNILNMPLETEVVSHEKDESKVAEEVVQKSKIVKSSEAFVEKSSTDSINEYDSLQVEVEKTRYPMIYNIQTKLLNIEISDKGASVKKVNLRDYKDNYNRELTIFDDEKLNLFSISNFFKDSVFYNTDIDTFVNIKNGAKSLIFKYSNSDLEITKEYIIESNSYEIDVNLSVQSKRPFSDISFKWESPILYNDFEDKDYASFISYINDEFDEIKKDSKEVIVFSNTEYFWTGIRTKYFWGGYIFPSATNLHSGEIYTDFQIDKNREQFFGGYSVDFEYPSNNNQTQLSYKLFFSPIDKYILSEYGYNLSEIAKYGFKILAPISNLILLITTFLHNIIGNWGITIILFSIMLKLLLYPLNKKTIESSRKMQLLQPQIKTLQKKHKSNPQLMQMEMMKLYKKNKVNPLSGCLPMLIQMPIFFSLYSVFRGAIQFRQAPFALWIQDLSQPEIIAQLNLGFFNLNIGVLVIISSLAMFFQMKMTIKDPKQKFMPYFMSIFLFFIFSNMSAGLNLYWATFNLMQYLQQKFNDFKNQNS